MKINFFDIGKFKNELLIIAVIVTRYKGKLVFVRHKGKNTWEVPAGHREENENINDTASRELYEETGAIEYTIRTVSDYCVTIDNTTNCGRLFYAQVKGFEKLPDFEIEEIDFFNNIPKNLTYPNVQPHLIKKVLSWKHE